jgi:hypothetical protein
MIDPEVHDIIFSAIDENADLALVILSAYDPLDDLFATWI